MKDKYDEELELAKSVMQKDFDETLKDEKVCSTHVHIVLICMTEHARAFCLAQL